jgi:hypothetical protein
VVISVLANDSDPAGMPLAVAAVGIPSAGSATTDGATVTYTPTAGFSGIDSFTYTINNGRLTALATITVVVGDGSEGSVYLPLIVQGCQ